MFESVVVICSCKESVSNDPVLFATAMATLISTGKAMAGKVVRRHYKYLDFLLLYIQLHYILEANTLLTPLHLFDTVTLVTT